MKFYLQSVSPEDVMEVNQAVTLSGVICDPWMFTSKELEVDKTLSALLEVMSSDQTVLVEAISAGFRAMLEESRKLKKLSEQMLMCVPAIEQGLMAMKAASRMGQPFGASQVFQSEQALICAANGARVILLDLENIGRFADSKAVLEQTLSILDEKAKQTVLVKCSNLEQFRMAAAAGAGSVSAPIEVYQQILFNVLGGSQMNQIRDEWILTYTRNEILE